ncbi:dephospho-CoA kinase [Salinivibrio sharmensis]|uniref:Dephospho-CoA kinase n=1 Tax=Salinivibrio sharmensis TaxID=390883 RepID=A0ABX3KL47_9GAMM|nr:dephospho-CoA kinase [Salinivibrio sharmensis]OOE90160.1 dephospho-CoA kinase [Salinivibrio sharmensis]
MAVVVGLTGGIGSGKTTVANRFAAKGIDIIDADVIAREVVAPGSDGLAAIVGRFGTPALTPDGSLDRAWLRERVFSHPNDKQWLDNLLHPMIRQRMIQACAQASSAYCLLVVPLLVENNLMSLAQRVLVVDVDEQTQIARTLARDHVSEQQVHAILAAQASRAQRLAVADDVIDNTQTEVELDRQVDALHHTYLTLATQANADP